MSSMVTWSRLGCRPPRRSPHDLQPSTRTGAQVMPLLLIEGTAWPGMGPPGRGPLRPPRPASSPLKLRANREVPVRVQDGGTERLRRNAKVRKARAPTRRVRQGCPETSPACSVVHTASSWLPTFHLLSGCLHEPSQSQPPCFPPPAASAYPT